MTDRFDLSRRQVLSGVATVGSIGAVSGVGTLGLFSDEELFTGNLLAAGELDLDLCWGVDGQTCSPASGPVTIDFGTLEKGDSGSATIQCSLEDNPAWTWLRTNSPDRPCGLQDKVRVSLWYDTNCNGKREADEPPVTVSLTDAERDAVDGQMSSDVTLNEPIPIRNLLLCDALSLLRFGTLLDPEPNDDSPAPFEPESFCCLGFEWEVEEFICVEDAFELDIEFYAEQWRHNPEPTTPWPNVRTRSVDCTEECDECFPKRGISFVAFCIEDGTIGEGDVELLPHYDVEGDVYKVEWWSEVPLDWVILFYGSNEGKFFENFFVDGDTAGVAHVNAATHTPDDDDYDSKLQWEGGRDVTDYGQCPRDPCPDFGDMPFGCGVRYNFEGSEDREPGEWDDVCGRSCSGEKGKGGG